jgi:RNA polymerase-binding transcription factor DksA
MTTNDAAAEPAAQLLTQRDHAREQLDRLQAEYESALEDAGVLQEDRDNVRVLLETARLAYEGTEAAVAHLLAGTYGTCVMCEGPIGTERLEALPGVTTCVTCQAAA